MREQVSKRRIWHQCRFEHSLATSHALFASGTRPVSNELQSRFDLGLKQAWMRKVLDMILFRISMKLLFRQTLRLLTYKKLDRGPQMQSSPLPVKYQKYKNKKVLLLYVQKIVFPLSVWTQTEKDKITHKALESCLREDVLSFRQESFILSLRHPCVTEFTVALRWLESRITKSYRLYQISIRHTQPLLFWQDIFGSCMQSHLVCLSPLLNNTAKDLLFLLGV
jgi:hypothetical protein